MNESLKFKVQSSKMQEKVESLPRESGVYIFENSKGKILYIGKAENLRERVKSYFRDFPYYNGKTESMMKQAVDVEYIVTNDEKEALLLECNLIKKHKPKYNVRLVDDKKFPYIKVTLNEDFPRIFPTRNLKRDGGKFFGPYTDVKAMKKALRAVRYIFPVRSCKPKLPSKSIKRACLDFHIGKCQAPCEGRVSKEEYREMIGAMVNFLQGRISVVEETLRKQMEKASEEMRFEAAGRLRDQLRAVIAMSERQVVMNEQWKDMDVLAYAGDGSEGCAVVLLVREGKLLGKRSFFMEGVLGKNQSEIFSAFIKQYYSEHTEIPDEIIIQEEPEEINSLKSWLENKKGREIEMVVPKGGNRLKEIKLAHENAMLILEEHLMNKEGRKMRIPDSLRELQNYLKLPCPPRRIEAFDISNIGANDAVGSMVSFLNGTPRKSEYRKFKIKTVSGQNDFAMMREVIYRRYYRLILEKNEMPDLILIDGGAGQLSAGLDALRSLGIKDQPVLGLAKRLEEIYVQVKGGDEPSFKVMSLPKTSAGLRLLKHLRDEAHRFAVSYHRNLSRKKMSHSGLEEIAGIGKERALRLIEKFGSLEGIKGANLEEIEGVPGLTREVALRVYERFGLNK